MFDIQPKKYAVLFPLKHDRNDIVASFLYQSESLQY